MPGPIVAIVRGIDAAVSMIFDVCPWAAGVLFAAQGLWSYACGRFGAKISLKTGPNAGRHNRRDGQRQ